MSAGGRELILIGTVHGDPDGLVRLLRLLWSETPRLVAVEVSPFGLAFRHRQGRLLRARLQRRLRRWAARQPAGWRAWGQVAAILSQLETPFEYRAAARYCRDSGATLCCIDASFSSRRLIREEWAELVSAANLAALLSQPPENRRAAVAQTYSRAGRLLQETETRVLRALCGWASEPVWAWRETDLAGRLEALYGRLPGGRLAYVGGWQHLVASGAGMTLYERVAHVNPRRILLGATASGCGDRTV